MKKVSFSIICFILLLGFMATSSFAEGPNPPGTSPGVEHNKEMNPEDTGTINPNANNTGVGVNEPGENFEGVIKSTDMLDNHGVLKDHKTHGSYQNNTNSCASCHQTHTASSRNLLFADSTAQTCSACHDGTLGFYNVYESGEAFFDSPSTAGTFGGTHAGNMSVHLATGAVKIKAAPGGNPTGTGSWDGLFTCASCHAPHGSYSDRLLHYNPNNMGLTPATAGGIQANMVSVVNFADRNTGAAQGAVKYKAVRGTKAEHSLTTGYEDIPAATVIMIYELTSTGNPAVWSYTKTTNPWLYSYNRGSGDTRHGYEVQFFTESVTLDSQNRYHKDDDGKVIDHYDYSAGTVGLKYDKGLIYSETTNLDNLVTARVGRAYQVKLKLDPVPGMSNVVTKHDVPDLWTAATKASGIQMSVFCGSCHTDYVQAASKDPSTKIFEANKTSYGHTTSSATYTCLRCHYAHGSDVEIMVDGMGENIYELAERAPFKVDGNETLSLENAKDYMLDKNPSSALKKFTGMSGCWACHNSSKATTIKNTNRDPLAPSGMIADPTTRPVVLPPSGD
ncbi:cytochrome c3 family protein [Anaerobacillus isosaccharinicus]|uniref:Cytochrome c3 family protein n=1 Tax=Anaerobacillus isosaccharinicus TaxID=1532552 RepID=A0A1S2LTQ3_9BACI|nr:cytochrome c3 family protein [Anaerobacillus isosaccharinicus]MBA5585435.1 cytochrome c3 family protein [Anaerobacillus isosaccharinicus]QOY36247.1 cytochrome c3 family protein [Anaerobacillus isosaccharinicus]